jgi:hypothetical protein
VSTLCITRWPACLKDVQFRQQHNSHSEALQLSEPGLHNVYGQLQAHPGSHRCMKLGTPVASTARLGAVAREASQGVDQHLNVHDSPICLCRHRRAVHNTAKANEDVRSSLASCLHICGTIAHHHDVLITERGAQVLACLRLSTRARSEFVGVETTVGAVFAKVQVVGVHVRERDAEGVGNGLHNLAEAARNESDCCPLLLQLLDELGDTCWQRSSLRHRCSLHGR